MDGMTEVSLLSTGFRAIAMLFIVLGLLILALYLMRRFLFFRRGAKGDLFIRILSSLHLSPKERIEVIEISGEKIVLGITPGNISFLTKLSDLPADREKLQGSNKDQEIKG
jgi:flagellar biosynthetic protein FliO